MSEDIVLMQVLQKANNVPIFLGLLKDIFPCVSCVCLGESCSRTEIDIFMKENAYNCSDKVINNNQVDKVIQSFETKKGRHATMLIGPTCAGKSVVMKVLVNARYEKDGT